MNPGRTAWIGLAAALLLPASAWGHAPKPAPAGVEAQRLAADLGGQPEHPRLLGTVMFVARWFHPGGTGGLHVSLYTVPAGANGEDLDRCGAKLTRDGWSRLVKTVEAHGREETLIYVRQRGRNRFDMLIATLDGGSELTIVRLQADPQKLVATTDTP